MYLTTQSETTSSVMQEDSNASLFESSVNTDDYDRHSNERIAEDCFDELLSKHLADELDGNWQYVGSDYSVQYKRLHKRFYALHDNELSIDLHRLTTVDEYKVADMTRCSYVMQEDQCVRVSVHATLVFKQ